MNNPVSSTRWQWFKLADRAAWQKALLRKLSWVMLALLILFSISTAAALAGLGWLATHHDKNTPWDVTVWVPKVSSLWTGYGMDIRVRKAEIWFDDGVVLRVHGAELYGRDGELAVTIDRLALNLAYRRLFALVPAPKVLEAEGVTLRLQREHDRLVIAGLDVGNEGADFGIVEWLNGLGFNPVWGRLEGIKIADLTLLLKDTVQDAAWVLENANLTFDRYVDSGERGSIVADLRRLYGGKEVPTMPVLVTFEHAKNNDKLLIEARFEQADMAIVADYLPEQARDFLRGTGRVVVGTTLEEVNTISRPWVTVNLKNVKVGVPEGYSAPLRFEDVLLSASYAPTPTDVLLIRRARLVTEAGLVAEISGTVNGLAGPRPFADISFASDKGDLSQVVALLPDVRLDKPVKWLNDNMRQVRFANLTGTFAHDLTTMKDCDKECGVNITADVVSGQVRYIPSFPVAKMESQGSFYLGEGGLVVRVPTASAGTFAVRDLNVTLENMFIKAKPTDVVVRGDIRGRAEELMSSLEGVIDKKIKIKVLGEVRGDLDLRVALVKGRPVIIEDVTPNMKVTLVKGRLENVPMLGTMPLDSLEGEVTVTLKKLGFEGAGVVDGRPIKLSVVDKFRTFGDNITIKADGVLPLSDVLRTHDVSDIVVGQGTLDTLVTVTRLDHDRWQAKGTLDAARASLRLKDLGFFKPVGGPLKAQFEAVARVNDADKVTAVDLSDLSLSGSGVNVRGHVKTGAGGKVTALTLDPFKLGASDAVIVWNDQGIDLSGRVLDLREMDLMSSEEKAEPSEALLQNGKITVDLKRLLLKQGIFYDVVADVGAKEGHYDLRRFTGRLGEDGHVNIRREPLEGQPGRSVMKVNVERLGDVLNSLGLYDKLKGGSLFGEIFYDAPDVGGGVLTLRSFELKKPPLLMQILGLISLQQLVAGTDAVLFERGEFPVRLDGPWVYLDRAILEGPSMSIRLSGSYNRTEKLMNFDGSLVPALPMNRLVSQIPLLGSFLTGSQDGLVVADFKLKGPTSDPEVSVKPLSVLTPGLLKDLFRGITGGGSPNTPPKVEDGRSQ